MNAYLSFILGVLCIFTLVGCDHYSTRMDSERLDNFNVVQASQINPVTFMDYLALEYYNLADYEQNITFDYKAAKHYVSKAERLLAGQMVAPDKVKSSKIKSEYRAELMIARENLIAAIEQYAIPENRIALALAQTRFDCWVDQAKEWPNDPDRLTCKSQYYENMHKLMLSQNSAILNYNFDGV